MSEALRKPRHASSEAKRRREELDADLEPNGNVYSLRNRQTDKTTTVQQRLLERFDGEIARAAIDGLAATRPQESAKRLLTPQQTALFAGLLLGFAAVLWRWPVASFVGFNVFVTIYFISAIFFRLWLLLIGRKEPAAGAPPRPMTDAQLPVITILLPLYRDAAALPTLARAVDRLDYPAHKKDVKLLLEEDDPETITEARKLGLDKRYETIVIPPQEPRTKPKACNYGLYLARGELIVIYDAEDLPDTDQLKKAAARFAEGDAKLACVQARLNYYNREDNWLTRGIMAQTPLEVNPCTP
ncbi:glycosyltransferase [Hyphococcus luteus]|uniref:glycosyltransferase n=1 Tax=Hyphococcus luteus TaxID=2058213 RepID=UPI0013FDB961|nr:glycosyltransferase [Marinicaulis flavus]